MTDVLDVKKIEKNYLSDNSNIRGIVYGRKLAENIKVEFSKMDFSKVYDNNGQSAIFELDVNGDKYDVLIRDIQYNHRTDNVHHVDFYAIVSDEVVETTVPIVFDGDTEAVTKAGGIVNTILSEVSVKALPKNIPSEIKIDVSGLDMNENTAIRVADMVLPEGVEIMGYDDTDTIVSVSAGVSAADAEEAANTKDVADVLAEAEDEEKEGEEGEKKTEDKK